MATGSPHPSTVWRDTHGGACREQPGPTEQHLSVSTTIDAPDRKTLDIYVGPSQADLLNVTTLDAPLISGSSPWNVPARGSADANSDLMIGNLAAALPARGFAIDTDRYGAPLYYADAPTPHVAVRNTTTWWRGFEAPIPPQATPDPGSDHHLAVWNVSSNRLYEFWNAEKSSDDRWTSKRGVRAVPPGW